MYRSIKCSLWVLVSIVSISVLTGCKNTQGQPAGSAPARQHVEGSLASAPLATGAVGDQDDPSGSDCFPRDRKDGPWTKGEAIRVLPPGQLAKVLPAEEAQRLAYFKITSLAQCAYQLPHSSAVPIARLLLITTESGADAYGLLTCRTQSDEVFRIGGETRVDRRDGITLHTWQGKCYLSAHMDVADAEATEELIRLVVFITGKIKKEPLPSLADAVPQDANTPGRRWLVRNLASLPMSMVDEIGGFPRDQINRVLGLGGDSMICVGAYGPSGTARSNVVWAAQYSSIKSAHDAFARYQRYLKEKKSDSVAQSTSVLPAQGMFLLGTWTAEEESMQYMLPRMKQLLPS